MKEILREFIAKSSEIYISVGIECLNFILDLSKLLEICLNCYRFLDDSLDKLFTAITSFPSLDASWTIGDLFKKKLAYPYEKCQTIESFYEQLKLGREDYLSTLKQFFPDFEEISRKQAIILKRKVANIKERSILFFLKKRCNIINR